MGRAILNWLRANLDAVRTSLWLVPTTMFLLGVLLAVSMLHIDRVWPVPDGETRFWLSSGDGTDARNLLSTLLGAVIAMASIVFSVTVVSLSLAANAYGPRLIRTFRSDRRTQIVLGIFVMTIVYILLVLRAVRGDSEDVQVPDASVVLGTLLALACVLALLAFIQGVATMIVADEVVRRVRLELNSVIQSLPLPTGAPPSPQLPDDFAERAARIRLPREGYVQSVEYSGILRWAQKHDAVVQLDFRPGDFIVEGDRRLLVYPPPDDPERVRREIDKFIASGQQRTPTQDVEFPIRHLVEVAVRALSPGINDPFTAMAVIDRLRGGLVRLCERELPPDAMIDEAGRLRVVRTTTTYRGAADAAFNQIRQAGAAKPSILIHMLQSIGAIAEHVRTPDQREALQHHARLIRAAGERNLDEPSDLADVEREYRSAMEALSRVRQA